VYSVWAGDVDVAAATRPQLRSTNRNARASIFLDQELISYYLLILLLLLLLLLLGAPKAPSLNSNRSLSG